jgi:hypothetical protein
MADKPVKLTTKLVVDHFMAGQPTSHHHSLRNLWVSPEVSVLYSNQVPIALRDTIRKRDVVLARSIREGVVDEHWRLSTQRVDWARVETMTLEDLIVLVDSRLAEIRGPAKDPSVFDPARPDAGTEEPTAEAPPGDATSTS